MEIVLEPLLMPVPPLAGLSIPVKLLITLEDILMKSLATLLQKTIHFSPFTTVTPVVYVGPVVYPRITTLYPPDVELLTTYILLTQGN